VSAKLSGREEWRVCLDCWSCFCCFGDSTSCEMLCMVSCIKWNSWWYWSNLGRDVFGFWGFSLDVILSLAASFTSAFFNLNFVCLGESFS